jgi:uncharacterized transporter YbjL
MTKYQLAIVTFCVGFVYGVFCGMIDLEMLKTIGLGLGFMLSAFVLLILVGFRLELHSKR